MCLKEFKWLMINSDAIFVMNISEFVLVIYHFLRDLHEQMHQIMTVCEFSIFLFSYVGRFILFQMYQHLFRHFEAHTAAYSPSTALWIRVICSLTLFIPVWTALTVGKKTKETSDQYILATTPPDRFFKIWIVIYMLEVFIMAYALFADCWSSVIWFQFAILNISCGIWAFTFNSGQLAGVNVSILCQFLNLIMTQLIWINLGDFGRNSIAGTPMGTVIRNIVAFFNGWFIAAAALGLFIILVYNCGMSLKVQLVLFWISVPIVYVAFLVYNIEVIGNFTDSIGMFVSMIWAVWGAAITSSNRKQASGLF